MTATAADHQDNASENFEMIREIIAEITNTDPAEIWPEANLFEDLNISEDTFATILRRLNKTFSIRLPSEELFEEFERLNIQHLLNYVEEEIELG